MIRYLREMFSQQLEDDEATQLQIFLDIWTTVAQTYPELWKRNTTFMTKVNLAALNEFIIDRIKALWEMDVIDIFDSDQLKAQVLKILNLLPSKFWETPWSIRVQDNANVRRLIKTDLNSLAGNTKLQQEWYEGLQIPNIE